MRRFPTVFGATVLTVILLLYMCTYQVRFSEVAIVKTFGKVAAGAVKTDPGLGLRWPWPIQNVVTYDKRIRILEDKTEETTTADGKNIIITTYTGWTIDDPYRFHVSFRNEEEGEKRLRTEIRAEKKAVVGQYAFANFVSTEPNELKLDQIEAAMRKQVEERMKSPDASAKSRYGVKIEMFGIKRLGVPEAVTQSIFENMKKAQEKKAQVYVEEGKAQAAGIVSVANQQAEKITAFARGKAKSIENDAQKTISEIYAAYKDHPDLRIFLDKVNALGEMLKARTTLILDASMEPIDLLSEEPRLRDTPPKAALDPPARTREPAPEDTRTNGE